MIRIFLTCVFTYCLLFPVFGQEKKSVIIGSYVEKPNAVLALNPVDKNQGFLLPQLSTQERISITPKSPTEDGLIVYDLTEKSFYYWKDNSWVKGLGADRLNEAVSFNASSNILTFASGETIDLSALKEVPASSSQNSGMYLTTDGTTLSWKPVSFVETQSLAFDPSTNKLSISSVQGSVDLNQLADRDKTNQAGVLIGSAGAVTGLTGNSAGQILKWNGAAWVVALENTDSQNLALSGNTLNIDRGTAANLSSLTAGGGIISGTLGALAIVDGSVTTNDLGNSIVTTQKLASGGNDKILTTDASGAVTWSDKISIQADASTSNETITSLNVSNNQLNILEASATQSIDLNVLSLNGDVSGTLNTSLVTKIQGQEVQAGTPTDGKVLKWQAGKWVFGDDNMGSLISSTITNYANIDVAEFKETNDPINENEHNIYRVFGPTSSFGYMSRRDKIKDIVAGIHIPQGAQLTQVTGYFWDNESNGREIELKLMRKELITGTISQVISAKTTGAAATVQSVILPAAINVDNSRYIYFVQVHMDLGANDYVADKLDLIHQRIYGVSYQYIEPSNLAIGPGVNQTIYVNAIAPLTPFVGQLWLDTTTNVLKYWNGTGWVAQQ